MASKSKRRGRVFRASCILAALIIAGSSFAWFTSKDEVTNRLSANADYDVKIVESFAPTKEWLPGQEVNKDVYATNTGSIAAMVKEEVNGRLAITYEADQAKWEAGCVELKDDEVYAVEDGSFLAYKPADSQKVIGTQIVTRPDDQSVPAAADFEPDTTGLYVFRRFIKVNADKTEEFKYDGYYYDATSRKYYKISNLQTYQDSHVADNTGGTWSFNDYWGDDADDDGVLMVASATFRKEKTEYVDPVDLIYKELVAGDLAEGQPYAGAPEAGKYLIATFDKGNNTAMADAEAKAEAYDKAKHEYEYALALYNQALKEYNLAKTGTEDGSTGGTTGSDKAKADLDQAKQDLEDAMQNLETAQAEYDNALNEYNIALAAVTAAKKDYDESMTKLYGSATGSETSYSNDSLYGKYKAAQDAKAASGAYGNIANEFGLWAASTPTPTKKATYTELNTAELKTFRDWVDANVTDAELHKEYLLTIDEQIAKVNYENEKAACLGTTGSSYSDATAGYGKTYNDALTTYKSKYTALGDTIKNTEATNAGVAAAELLSTDSGKKAALDAAKAAINTVNTGKQAVYDKALEDYEAALDKTNEAEALKDAAEALKEAADAVQTAAENKYNTAKTDGAISESDKDPLKIYIKLNDDAVITAQNASTTNEMWYLNPQAAADGSLINDTAVFYYTGLLEGGETSAKLVDYVYLDKNTKANYYKNFDFDINVALKSAQINLDENGNIKTDAASELGQFAVYNGGVATDNADKVITWSDTQAVSPAPGDAAGTTYTANTASGAITITKLASAVSDGTNTYQYTYNDGTSTYYGNNLASGATFTKGTLSGSNVVLDSATTVTLTSDAVKA